MRTKFITSLMLALVCGLPITAKVYTIHSLLGDLVVNVHVDKSITWDVAKGKTQVLQPSVISLQTDKQTFGVNPKVRKASVTNWKNDDYGVLGNFNRTGEICLSFFSLLFAVS